MWWLDIMENGERVTPSLTFKNFAVCRESEIIRSFSLPLDCSVQAQTGVLRTQFVFPKL